MRNLKKKYCKLISVFAQLTEKGWNFMLKVDVANRLKRSSMKINIYRYFQYSNVLLCYKYMLQNQ